MQENAINALEEKIRSAIWHTYQRQFTKKSDRLNVLFDPKAFDIKIHTGEAP